MFYQSLAREDTNHTLSKIQIRRNNFKKWLQHEMHRLAPVLDSSGSSGAARKFGTLCRPVPATVFPVLDPTSVLGPFCALRNLKWRYWKPQHDIAVKWRRPLGTSAEL